MQQIEKMGFKSCVALIIGACVGSAIFSISGMTIYDAGPAAIITWILAAVIYGIYGIVITKLAKIFPRSGGIYIFPRLAIGNKMGVFLGFISGWGYILSNIIAIAFSTIYIGKYLAAGFPELSSGTLISIIALILAFILLSIRGNRSQIIQNTLVIILIIAILFYCYFAFFGGGFDIDHFENFFLVGTKGPDGFVTAIPLAMVAYGGSVSITFMAAEVKHPERNIHRSLIIGLAIVAVLYATLITAIVGTLPFEVLQQNEELRYLPLFASIMHGGLTAYPWLVKLISVCVTLALFTTICVLLRVNARAMQAISKEGLLPKFLSKESNNGIAQNALWVMCAICIALCFKPQWTEELISLGAVLNIVSMSITCYALIAAKDKYNGLAITAIILLWMCYIPEVYRGSYWMWIFTLAVYLVALIFFIAFKNRWKKVAYRLSGEVVHGKGHGRLYSIPTANLKLDSGCEPPMLGVWATRVFIDGVEYKGLTNVGYRPTDDDSDEISVETKILEYSGDLYGKRMTLEFVKYIRGTRKFANMNELQAQIEEDFRKLQQS